MTNNKVLKWIITVVVCVLIAILVLFALERLNLATITINHSVVEHTPTVSPERQSSWSV